MLDPGYRRSLLEALRPEAGYSFDKAIGTTFSLDLLTLLTAPVAFTFFSLREEDSPQNIDPIALLNALTRYASRIHLFCQVGRIQAPVVKHPLYAFLESSVIQVRAPKARRVFHPKLWVLRYAAHQNPDWPVRYRVLCLSRNLTFDRSWDTALVLSGQLCDGEPPRENMLPLSEFVAALPHLALYDVPTVASADAALMANELQHVQLDLPEHVTDLKFMALGLGDEPIWPFDIRLERMAVISPFVRDDLLRRLAGKTPLRFVVAELSELQKLPPEAFTSIEAAYMLADEALPESTDKEDTQPGEGEELTTARRLPELRGLHAKLYIGEKAGDAYVWTGSANATSAAFDGNVEFLARLTGPRQQLGIDAFLNGHNRDGFNPFLKQFWPAEATATDSIQESMDTLLDLTRETLAYMELQGRVDILPDGTFAIEIVSKIDRPPLSPAVKARCWPITLRSERASEFVQNAEGQSSVHFSALSKEALTTFFVFELTTQIDNRTANLLFVLSIPLSGLPVDRETYLLKAILSDPAKLLQLIALLLHGASEDLSGFFQALGTNSSGPQATSWQIAGIPLFEAMVRALHCDPSRIDTVAELIERLRADPDTASLLPSSFDEIWQPVWQARQELNHDG